MTEGWTYGAEHEWADWPLERELPEGYGIDTRDKTIVNSNGIANDPKGKMYKFGGEINTPPTDTPYGQVECLHELMKLLPEAKVNYRSNLHIHVRVPGLGQDLAKLKQVQLYIHNNMRTVLLRIQPLQRPVHDNAGGETSEEYHGALRRWKRRRVSHQTLLPKGRLEHQLQATTLEEFYEREVPQSKAGKPMWHFQPRLCVNLRQHRETDTVEFRHFAGTMDAPKLWDSVLWCKDFLIYALEGRPIQELLDSKDYGTEDFPQFPSYVHWMEERYRRTVHDGSVPKATIAENIELILQEEREANAQNTRIMSR